MGIEIFRFDYHLLTFLSKKSENKKVTEFQRLKCMSGPKVSKLELDRGRYEAFITEDES